MTTIRTRIARLTFASALALGLVGSMAGSASAAVSELTIDRSAELSPGHLHALLTGTVTCDPGTSSFLSAQIIQSKGATGLGSATVACDGTQQAYAIDVSAGVFGSAGAFRPGKASAQVSTTTCDPFTWMCTSQYTDATIRLSN